VALEVSLLEDAIVEARGLSVRYGATLALDDVSLRLERGRVLAVVGANGAGKSSLFRALLGLLPVAGGEPRIFGRVPQALTPSDRSRIAYVSERHAELGHATIPELVDLREALYAAFDRALFDELMRDLKVPPDRTVDTLSRGQRAGVAVGLALSQRPDLLLLDDPTLGLDPLARRRIVQSLLRVASGGEVTVLFATHELADVERVADEVLLLRRGRGAVAVDTDTFVAESAAFWVPTDVPRAAIEAIDGVVWVWPQRRGQHVVLRGDAERLERASSALRALCERPDLEEHAVSFEELALAWLAADREMS
jgi:ABC-2 type transport system ATP-binding protein